MSTKAPCSTLRTRHILSHSALALCDRYYYCMFTELTGSEKDKITKAVNGRARICHHSFMGPNACSSSTMPGMANYCHSIPTPLRCLSKKDSQFRNWTEQSRLCRKVNQDPLSSQPWEYRWWMVACVTCRLFLRGVHRKQARSKGSRGDAIPKVSRVQT